MRALRHIFRLEVDGILQTSTSYQILEATPDELTELADQPEGTANDWVEANAEIVTESELTDDDLLGTTTEEEEP